MEDNMDDDHSLKSVNESIETISKEQYIIIEKYTLPPGNYILYLRVSFFNDINVRMYNNVFVNNTLSSLFFKFI